MLNCPYSKICKFSDKCIGRYDNSENKAIICYIYLFFKGYLKENKKKDKS
jgi:hypothetical protein